MNEAQFFFATAGLVVTLFVAGLGFFKYYLDAKIDGVNARIEAVNARLDGIDKRLDGISRQLETLVTYMIDHSVRIGILEEKTKKL